MHWHHFQSCRKLHHYITGDVIPSLSSSPPHCPSGESAAVCQPFADRLICSSCPLAHAWGVELAQVKYLQKEEARFQPKWTSTAASLQQQTDRNLPQFPLQFLPLLKTPREQSHCETIRILEGLVREWIKRAVFVDRGSHFWAVACLVSAPWIFYDGFMSFCFSWLLF